MFTKTPQTITKLRIQQLRCLLDDCPISKLQSTLNTKQSRLKRVLQLSASSVEGMVQPKVRAGNEGISTLNALITNDGRMKTREINRQKLLSILYSQLTQPKRLDLTKSLHLPSSKLESRLQPLKTMLGLTSLRNLDTSLPLFQNYLQHFLMTVIQRLKLLLSYS